MRLALALPLLLVAAPAPALALAATGPGAPHQRTSPELSDIALFVMAVLGVWLVRRSLRKRFEKKVEPPSED